MPNITHIEVSVRLTREMKSFTKLMDLAATLAEDLPWNEDAQELLEAANELLNNVDFYQV